jgi:RTA1 like protein
MVIISCFNTAVITCTAQGASTYFSQTASSNMITSGLALIKASLFLQLIFNAAFVGILVLLQHRQNIGYHQRDQKITTVMLTLYALIGLILVRNVFRTVQIFVSPLSPLWTVEAYFWVFEACVMLAYTTLFHVMHPAKYLTGWCTSGRGCSSVENGSLRQSHSDD